LSFKTQKIRKVVFPVAGPGMRLLPETKAMPKMLFVVDRPLIQYAVDEALPRNASGKILRKNLRAPYWAGYDRQVN